jgi:hypothetical protein
MVHGAMLALADDAAPDMMMASMVTLLMMPITLVNHAVVTFGLKAIRTSRLTVDSGTPSVLERNRRSRW